MKKYFEYPFNETLRKKLIVYYNDPRLQQHGTDQDKKTELKIKRIECLEKFKKTDTVLDVGCSSGYLLRKLSTKIKYGEGADISTSIIKKNKKIKFKNLKFNEFDGVHLNNKKTFSKIMLIDVLEHAFEPEQLIKNIADSAQKNTRVIIEVPTSGWVSEMIFGQYHQGHLRYYDPEYLVEYLKKHGLTVEKIELYNSVPLSSKVIKFKKLYYLLDKIVNFIPPKIYPYFGEIIVIAKRTRLD